MHAAGDLPSFLTALHTKHGPIAAFWFGEIYTVSLAAPKLFKPTERMFDRHPALFQLLEPLISSKSQQFANGEHGQHRYRLFSRAFNQAAVEQVLPQVVKVTKQELTHLAGTVALEQKMMSLAITIITQTHFGAYCKERGNLARLLEFYMKVFTDFDDCILGKWTLGQGDSREKDFYTNVTNFKNVVWQIVEAHRERKISGEFETAPFLDILLDHVDDDDDVLAQAITFLVGGFHTTGINLTWLIYYICLYPKVQETMRQEIRDVIGGQKLVSMEQVDGLQYVRKVMDETLRISRIGTFTERQVTKDTVVDGYTIPAGTQLLNAIGLTLMDKEFFPDPEQFDPERAGLVKGAAFSPFGSGVRKCPGFR
jgi:cytochrome P450 family 20 subfamily A